MSFGLPKLPLEYSSIDAIMQHTFANQTELKNTLLLQQLRYGSIFASYGRLFSAFYVRLNPPKSIIGTGNSSNNKRSGYYFTYSCRPPCVFRVYIVPTYRGGKRFYKLTTKDDGNTNHSDSCCEVCVLKPSELSLLFDAADVKKSINVLHQGFQSRGIHVDKSVVGKALRMTKANLIGTEEKNVRYLRNLGINYMNYCPGSLCVFEKDEDNQFTRFALIPQIAVAFFKANFLQKVISIDGGHRYRCIGKMYRLLLVYTSTGNNQNLLLAWAIADGETKDNLVFLIDTMEKGGIKINSPDCVVMTDKGAAVVAAVKDRLPHAHHTYCAMHHLGVLRSLGWGTSNKMYWKFAKIYNTPQAYHLGIEELRQSNCIKTANVMTALLSISGNNVSVDGHTYTESDANVFRYLRERKQSNGNYPPTYTKVSSNAEQGMSVRLEQRKFDMLHAFINETLWLHEFQQKQIAIFNEINSFDSTDDVKRILVPYAARNYLHVVLPASAKVYRCDYKGGDIFVCSSNDDRTRVVKWESRSCDNCNMYASFRLACPHLIATWRVHRKSGILRHYTDSNWNVIEENDITSTLKHLYGICYHVDTMNKALRSCVPMIPMSLDMCTHAMEENVKLKTGKPQKGRPESKRKASNMDGFRSGARSKSLQNKKNADNIEQVNEVIVEHNNSEQTDEGSSDEEDSIPDLEEEMQFDQDEMYNL